MSSEHFQDERTLVSDSLGSDLDALSTAPLLSTGDNCYDLQESVRWGYQNAQNRSEGGSNNDSSRGNPTDTRQSYTEKRPNEESLFRMEWDADRHGHVDNEADTNWVDKTIEKGLPIFPSRLPADQNLSTARGITSRKLPRNIPRRVKGQYRRIAGDAQEGVAGRIASYCPAAEINLDKAYARMIEVRRRYGVKPFMLPSAPGFSFETNKELIIPPFEDNQLRYKPSAGAVDSSLNNEWKFNSGLRAYIGSLNTIDDPTWIASIFFDVLHLRQISSRNYKWNTNDNETGNVRLKTTRDASQGKEDTQVEDRDENLKKNKPMAGYREVFIFGFGAIVFWNWDSVESELEFLRSISEFCGQVYGIAVAENASDDLNYFCGLKSRVQRDTVELGSNDPIERLAYSYAIAQSSLLSVYEYHLDLAIARNEHIPVTLAASGKIKMTQTEISKEIGRLFMERNLINLESDIKGTPEIFWEDDEFEPVYKRMCSYMEHEDRHIVLNKRLDLLHELLDVLRSQVENQHGNKLEMIIIYLIAIEVLNVVIWQMFIKDILGFFNHCGG